MEKFFKKPTVDDIVTAIYRQVIFVHETGGSECNYKISKWMSTSFIDEVIERLNDLLLDADIIEYDNAGYLRIDWS